MAGPDDRADRELAAALANGAAAVAQAGSNLLGAVRDLTQEQGELHDSVDRARDASERAASYSATAGARVDTARLELGDQVAQLGERVDSLAAEVRSLRRTREAYSVATVVVLVLVALGALGAGLYAACEPHSAARLIQGDGLAGGKRRPAPQPEPRRPAPDMTLGKSPTDTTVDPPELPSESDRAGCAPHAGTLQELRPPACRDDL